MATIINTPGNSNDSSGVNMIVGILFLIVVVVLFFVYALPAIRNGQAPQKSGADININLPTGGDNGAAPKQ